MSGSSRAFAKWLSPMLLVLAMLAIAGCEELREVRKVFEPTQETSQAAPPPAPSSVPAPAPARAPETAALPPARAPAAVPQAAPLPGLSAPPEGVQLKPPPGVVPLLRVAVLLPLSGPEAKLGQALLNAAQLALFSLADESFALLPVDTRGTPEGAAAAARSAIEDGARLILGPIFAAEVAAAAPVARAAGVQMVSFSNDRSVAGNGVFILGFTPETQINRVVSYAVARGVRRVAAIVPSGAYGDRVRDSLIAAASANGIGIGGLVRYMAADTETLSPLIRRLANYDARRATLLARRRELEDKTDEASRRALKRLEGVETLGDVDFDAVLMPEGGSSLRAIAPLLPFFDVDPRKVRMLGTTQWDDPSVATEPSLFGAWFPASAPRARGTFDDIYRKTFSEPAPRIASLAYDATALAAVLVRGHTEATRLAVATRGAVPPAPASVFSAEALTAANGFAGVDGIFRLLPSGLSERGLAVIEVRNRRFAVVSPAPNTFQKP